MPAAVVQIVVVEVDRAVLLGRMPEAVLVPCPGDAAHRASGRVDELAVVPAGPGAVTIAQSGLAPRGAPNSFADLAAQLQPAVVNIATKQK